MNKYEAIIFDLDGVICSTDQYHYEAWKALADELEVYFDKEINNRLRGVSRMDSLEIILENYDGILKEEEKEKMASKKNNLYRKKLEQMTEKDVTKEVVDTLDELNNKGVHLAIGSSSRNAKLILNQIGITDKFEVISDGTNITKSKPNPEVFEKAAEMLNIDAKKCLVVEDAKAGLIAALAANMDCAAIGDATKSGFATYNLSSFSDLLNII